MPSTQQDWWNMKPEDRNKYLFSQHGFDPHGNNELGTMYQQYAAALYPQVGADLNFMGELAGKRRDAIMGLIGDLGPAGLKADAAAYGAGADENAAKASRQAALSGKASGLGDGFVAGQQAGAYGQAASDKNAYLAQQQSPGARIQRASALLQAMEGGFNSPALGLQQSLFGPIEQRHQQNQSEVGSGSFMNTVAQVAGMYTGMGGGIGGSPGGTTRQPDYEYGAPGASPFDGGNGPGAGYGRKYDLYQQYLDALQGYYGGGW